MIHLQLLPVILQAGMRYRNFLLWRVISALLSYCTAKLFLLIFPIDVQVFSNSADNTAVFPGVNISLSLLMIFGCFVFVLDLEARKKRC